MGLELRLSPISENTALSEVGRLLRIRNNFWAMLNGETRDKKCILVGIEAGSRYEVNYPSGTSHFIEKLAFLVFYSINKQCFSLLKILLQMKRYFASWKVAVLC